MVVGHRPGDAGGRQVELLGPRGDAVLRQGDGEGPEGVGLHHVAAHLEERGVQLGHHVGAGDGQDLIATLQRRPAEVVGAEVTQLEVGAGGPVENDDALAHRLQESHGHRVPTASPHRL